jgi:hypothetical protein
MNESMTMRLRKMPEILEIADYLRELTFKHRVFGGCDENDVLDRISDITLKYEAVISSLLRQCDELEFAPHPELARLERERNSYESYYQNLVWQYEEANAHLRAQNAQLQHNNAALWAELEQWRRTGHYAA